MHHIRAFLESVYQLAEAVLQRAEQRSGTRALGTRSSQNAAGQAAVLGFDFDEARQHAVHAHLAWVAAVDARQQGLSQIVDGFLAVMIEQKIVNGAIRVRGFRRAAKEFETYADLGAPAQQIGSYQRENFGGNHHHQAVGKWDQLSVFQDVGYAQMVVGADYLIG